MSDIVQANLLAMEQDSMNDDFFNVGTGRRLAVIDIADGRDHGAGEDVRPRIVGKYREGDIRHCYGDISKIRHAAGYLPKVTFEAGIPMLVDWCRHQSANDKVVEATRELDLDGIDESRGTIEVIKQRKR